MNKYQEALFFIMTHLDIKGGEDYQKFNDALNLIGELVAATTGDDDDDDDED